MFLSSGVIIFHTRSCKQPFLPILSFTSLSAPPHALPSVRTPSVAALSAGGRLRTVRRLAQRGDVHRARQHPLITNVVCARTPQNELGLYNLNRHNAVEEVWKPDAILAGHGKEGYGMNFSLTDPTKFASCAYDGTVCLWDIDGKADGVTVQPLAKFFFSENGIPAEDVAFCPDDSSTLYCVGDEGSLSIHDIRGSTTRTKLINSDANCIAFHHTQGNLFLVGGSDGVHFFLFLLLLVVIILFLIQINKVGYL